MGRVGGAGPGFGGAGRGEDYARVARGGVGGDEGGEEREGEEGRGEDWEVVRSRGEVSAEGRVVRVLRDWFERCSD